MELYFKAQLLGDLLPTLLNIQQRFSRYCARQKRLRLNDSKCQLRDERETNEIIASRCALLLFELPLSRKTQIDFFAEILSSVYEM